MISVNLYSGISLYKNSLLVVSLTTAQPNHSLRELSLHYLLYTSIQSNYLDSTPHHSCDNNQESLGYSVRQTIIIIIIFPNINHEEKKSVRGKEGR